MIGSQPHPGVAVTHPVESLMPLRSALDSGKGQGKKVMSTQWEDCQKEACTHWWAQEEVYIEVPSGGPAVQLVPVGGPLQPGGGPAQLVPVGGPLQPWRPFDFRKVVA